MVSKLFVLSIAQHKKNRKIRNLPSNPSVFGGSWRIRTAVHGFADR